MQPEEAADAPPAATEETTSLLATLRSLCSLAVRLALRLNAHLADLEAQQGYAELRVTVERGKLGRILVTRTTKV